MQSYQEIEQRGIIKEKESLEQRVQRKSAKKA